MDGTAERARAAAVPKAGAADGRVRSEDQRVKHVEDGLKALLADMAVFAQRLDRVEMLLSCLEPPAGTTMVRWQEWPRHIADKMALRHDNTETIRDYRANLTDDHEPDQIEVRK